MVDFGTRTDVAKGFFVLGSIITIVISAIMIYVFVSESLPSDDWDYWQVYNNGWISNITIKNTTCLWDRDCSGPGCGNEFVQKQTGCCKGCKNPNSCNLPIKVKWKNVPIHKLNQRIVLFVTSDCKTWWQTGFTPNIIEDNYMVDINATEDDLYARSYTPNDYQSYLADPSLLSERDSYFDLSEFENNRPANAGEGEGEEGNLYESAYSGDDVSLGSGSRRKRGYSYLLGNESSLPGHSTGAFTVTDTCMGDPFRQMAIMACITTKATKNFVDKTYDGTPDYHSYRCRSLLGICTNLNDIFVKDLPCCSNGQYITDYRPSDSSYYKEEDEDD